MASMPIPSMSCQGLGAAHTMVWHTQQVAAHVSDCNSCQSTRWQVWCCGSTRDNGHTQKTLSSSQSLTLTPRLGNTRNTRKNLPELSKLERTDRITSLRKEIRKIQTHTPLRIIRHRIIHPPLYYALVVFNNTVSQCFFFFAVYTSPA